MQKQAAEKMNAILGELVSRAALPLTSPWGTLLERKEDSKIAREVDRLD